MRIKLFIGTLIFILVFLTACTNESKKIFDCIDINDGVVEFEGVYIGDSTFQDVEKAYSEVDINDFNSEESFILPFFDIAYSHENNSEKINMTKRYTFSPIDLADSEEINANSEKFFQDEYEYFKDYIVDSLYVTSDDCYDLEKANELTTSFIDEATEILGEPDEKLASGNSNSGLWKLSESTTLQISMIDYNQGDFKVGIVIQLNPGYYPYEN